MSFNESSAESNATDSNPLEGRIGRSSSNPRSESNPAGPAAPAPVGPARSAAQSVSGSANEKSAEHEQSSAGERPARRRGSRGGKKRRKPQGPGSAGQDSEQSANDRASVDRVSVDRAEYDRRPADLPDAPHEGVPSPAAAARAEVAPSAARNESGPGEANNESGRARNDGRGEGRTKKRRRASSGPRTDRPEGGSETGEQQEQSGGQRRGGTRTELLDHTADTEKASGGANQRGRRRGRNESDRSAPIETRRESGTTDRFGRPTGRYLMCVHTRSSATQIAVLEGRSLIEHYVSRPTDAVGQIHGNIYVGRIQNVLPGMEAAFVDIGTPKNAVLYRGDLTLDADTDGASKSKNDVRIEQILTKGQMVTCQVTKNPIGSKGARLTQEVSLPGRFVVLIPNSDTYGISKRLPDDERRRLRSILDGVRPKGHGLIVRTAAEGATADELRRDVLMLVGLWERIDAQAKKASRATLLHREPDLAVRVIREEFNRNYRGVVIDSRELYEEIKDYVTSITPELADRVEYHDPSAEQLPIFEKFHVHEQLHKAIDRKVWLPSGGSLIIERTEALTVIDVNTGKNVGSSSLEETVFKNNLEAADEIARQLRLRDIGGIIVIDFIDMEIRTNRDAVVRAFREALSRDKTRTQVFDISELGLVEMTRKRISEGLVESLSGTCPTCEGRGFVFDQELVNEIF